MASGFAEEAADAEGADGVAAGEQSGDFVVEVVLEVTDWTLKCRDFVHLEIKIFLNSEYLIN